jgi:hypothetical protein
VDYLVSTGMAAERRENDLLGLALGAGRDASGAGDWQGVLEGFYRWQWNASIHVTPAIQVIFGEGLPGKDVRLVAGIRGSLAF